MDALQLAVAVYTEYSKTKTQRVYASELYIEEHAGPVSWTWGCITHHMSLLIIFSIYTNLSQEYIAFIN